MLHRTQAELPTAIYWIKPGQSVGFMQGEAINKLLKEYPGTRRAGYAYTKDEDNFDILVYLLDGLKTRHADGIVKRTTVAFKEMGDHLAGWCIYWPKDDAPVPGKLYALTGGVNSKSISNGDTWGESEVAKANG